MATGKAIRRLFAEATADLGAEERRETSYGVLLTIGIVLTYWLMVMLGRALRSHTGFYPELIAWTPNIVFQGVGIWLFSKANLK